ncbi:MAG: DUF3786 domain-containing protein [Mahellales bacterium]|jgi:hypothetical protein
MLETNNMQRAYTTAYDKGWNELANIDSNRIGKGKKIQYDKQTQTYYINFMGRDVQVSIPDRSIDQCNGPELGIVEKVLIVHYLIKAQDRKLDKQWISFKEIPGGNVYYDAFYKRAIKPLKDCFGNNLEDFCRITQELGWRKGNIGDTSAVCSVFPTLPIIYVIWQGDEEIPSTSNILFDSSAPDILSTEDLAVAASLPAYQLIKILYNRQ